MPMPFENIAVKVGKLEERMNSLEKDILAELNERKANQKEIKDSVEEIKKKVWLATGFLMAVQIVLQVVLRAAFK